MNPKLLFPAALLVAALACNTSKKNTGSAGIPSEPDPVALSSKPNYQPSPTRVADIIHTRLEVRPDWQKRWLYGQAIVLVSPYFYPITELDLDARGMYISRVALYTAPGVMSPLDYTYIDNKVLRIKLGQEFNKGDHFRVLIDYIAKPDELGSVGGSAAITSDKGLYFINPQGTVPNKPTQFWTQGETQSNSVWFPTIDRPNEKMTEEVLITVENKYKTLSNGLLVKQTENSDGTRTDHWKMDMPHAVYLVMMAAGEFSVVKDQWRGKEVSYYVEPEFEPYARNIFGKTPRMMEFFSNKFGVDYPWPKYSQICTRDFVSGAMENTTCTNHGEFVQRTPREMLDRTYEEYISHELSHHWFGDLVTCESWSNLPLNESFATYCEYLWNEHEFGREKADAEHYISQQGYLYEAQSGKKEPLIRYFYDDREDMFDSHSYNKGGQVLHMLRQEVGDAAFFASIKLHLERNKFRSAEIHDLRMAFEETTGRDLNWFFDQWFLAPGHPELDIAYSYDAAAKKQNVIIRQIQDRSKGCPVYRLPLNIDIYVNGKTERRSIVVSKLEETFSFDAAAKPDLVNVDADKILLCTKKDDHTPEEWAFMYANAPLFVDRMEALNGLAKDDAESELAVSTMKKALNDKYPDIRAAAVTKLYMQTRSVKSEFIRLVQTDPESSVRYTALLGLTGYAKGEELRDVFLKACNDSSYNVVTTALCGLLKQFPEDGKRETAARENDPARSMKLAVITAWSLYGDESKQAWMEKAVFSLQGRFFTYASGNYAYYLTRCPTSVAEKALTGIENYYKVTEYKEQVRSMFSQMERAYTTKANYAQQKIDEMRGVKSNATGIAKLEADRAEWLRMAEVVRNRKKAL